MGIYDTVWVKCPKCGEEEGFQSKSGACALMDYTLENCPDDVMVNVNRHSPYQCEKCGTFYEVDIINRKPIIHTPTEPGAANTQQDEKDLYGMKLNDQIKLSRTGPIEWDVTRVPGGWIYSYVRLDSNSMMAVFVPYHNEFQ